MTSRQPPQGLLLEAAARGDLCIVDGQVLDFTAEEAAVPLALRLGVGAGVARVGRALSSRPMRSFIVWVYRRRRGGELSGTVQAVDDAAQPAVAFASASALLQQMAAPSRPKPLPGGAATEAPKPRR